MQALDQVPEVLKLLKDDPSFTVRAAAVSALGDMQAKDRAAEVLKLLKDPNLFVRGAAVTALGTMQAKGQVAEVLKLLKDPNEIIRGTAVAALGAMQAKDQAAEVIKLLKDTSSWVRPAAVYALGDMQAKDQIAEVIKLLKDPDENVRIAAINALGEMHAKNQVAEVLKFLKDPNNKLRRTAVYALGDMQAKDQIAEVIKLLKDPDENVRSAAVYALDAMQAKDQAAEVFKLLKDPEADVRTAAAYALGAMGPFSTKTIVFEASEIYYADHARQAELRFLCYYLTGGDAKAQLILSRIMFGLGQKPVRTKSLEKARATLRAFAEVMPTKRTDSEFAEDADRQILQIAEDWKGKWSPTGDAMLFSELRGKMGKNNAVALGAIIEVPWWLTALETGWKIIAVHALLWSLLIYLYPTSPNVQAFFFWNGWARTFIGFGYVDFLLTWIPFLRDRLLAPFRDDLIADARIGDSGANEYFEDVEVKETGVEAPPMRLSTAIPEVRGQTILEGESGLGKSKFLRNLVQKAKAPIVYLPAANCENGPLEAIKLKLKGKASDESFLKSIIYSGGLRVVIDGLNEVTVETREKIRRFVDEFPKAHVLLATQPLQWKRPPDARVLRLQKLSDDRILRFLESRYSSLRASKRMAEEDYKAQCKAYVEDVLGPGHSEEEQSAARLVLSNPMDLTTAAQILVSGTRPTLGNLQEQQFKEMESEFKDTHPGQEFPLNQLSESIYERRLKDELALDSAQFFEAIQSMVASKLALEQNDKDATGKGTKKWVVRHDKIRDFFLIKAFEGKEDIRIPEHIDDSRFRGVYLMLASNLPFDQAKALKDALVDRAAETKDHYLSDAVVQILRVRNKLPAP